MSWSDRVLADPLLWVRVGVRRAGCRLLDDFDRRAESGVRPDWLQRQRLGVGLMLVRLADLL